MNPYLLLGLLDYVMVMSLGSTDYSERELVSRFLEGRNHHCVAALEEGIKSKDSEIRRRCLDLRLKTIDRIIDSLEPLPEIDSAWYDVDRQCIYAYSPYKNVEFTNRFERMNPYLEAIGKDRVPWVNYYKATRLWLRAELAHGRDLEELKSLLEEMHRRDRVFLWRYWHDPN